MSLILFPWQFQPGGYLLMTLTILNSTSESVNTVRFRAQLVIRNNDYETAEGDVVFDFDDLLPVKNSSSNSFHFGPLEPFKSKTITLLLEASTDGIRTIRASCNETTASRVVDVILPTENPTDITVNPGESITIIFIPLAGYDYNATLLGGDDLPPFLQFDSEILVINGIIPNDQEEDIDIVITGTDTSGGGEDVELSLIHI
eukprot:TRINITY_DN17276_c0_g1_i1.p1 TRINITY_DN17276_c0_g1~~TRINITY_DN17276_c0_g1_i1.p1  ORF type:complete len:202 (+),score=17.43 TRINITY_DN17276_c0_g1_i1:311-916(+)